MDDLISRQAAIDAVSDALKGVFVENEDIAKNLIGKLPSVQPEKKGRWVRYGDHYVCSECNEWALMDWEDQTEDDYFDKKSDFCPHCGACMEEGKQDA